MGTPSNGTQLAHVPRLALSPDELAEALGVSRDHVDRHIAADLPWVYRGRRKFVPVKAVEAWLERSATRALAEELAR